MVDFQYLFSVLGFVTAVLLFLSPIWTFVSIKRSGTTGGFSGMPYITTFFNCLVSGWYGLSFVSKNNSVLWILNFPGAAIEFIYVVLFICFANDKTVRNKLGAIWAGAVAVFVIVVLVSVFGFHGNSRTLFCGYAAIIGSICMYGSPLSVIRVVIQTKKVDYMPFSVSLCGLLCSICWLVYGILGHDVFVIVPNGIGCALGALQLIIYVIYYYKNAKPGEGALLENAASDQ